MYRYIFARTGFQKEIAEDLAQETFVKFLEYRDQFNSEKGSIKTWLFTIAHNLVIDTYRAKKFTVNIKEAFLDNKIDPDQEINDKALLINVIKTNLCKLPEKDQELLTLRYINEMELVEIAGILKLEYANLKVAVNRALHKLSKLINNNDKHN
ncbi:MAG: RNA polymerase sigma factor [bacterium]